jgi:hypothetical protein
MDRAAPKEGYDFGNKRQYRRRVWAAASEAFAGTRATAQVLIMPSIEGDEIDEAIRHGFRQNNIHVVDKNPAIVAHIKRRYPFVASYGVDIVSACQRMADKGVRLSVANFDLCGTVDTTGPILERATVLDCFEDHNLVFASIFRGRETRFAEVIEASADISDDLHRVYGLPKLPDNVRAASLLRCLSGTALNAICPKFPFIYKSTANTTMMCCGLFRKTGDLCDMLNGKCSHCAWMALSLFTTDDKEYDQTLDNLKSYWKAKGWKPRNEFLKGAQLEVRRVA